MDVLFLTISGALLTYIPQRCFVRHENFDNNTTGMQKQQQQQQHPLWSTTPIVTSSSFSFSSFSGHNILFTLSLGLSLLLFTLNILELFPQSWLLFMLTDNNSTPTNDSEVSAAADGVSSSALIGNSNVLQQWNHILQRILPLRTITDWYRIVLWFITINCMIIIPATMGIQIALVYYKSYLLQRDVHSGSDPKNENQNSNHVVDDEERKKRNFRIKSDQSRYHWLIRIIIDCVSIGSAFTCKVMYRYIFIPIYRAIQYYIIIPIGHKLQCRCSRKDEGHRLPRTYSENSNIGRVESRYRQCFMKFSNHILVKCWYDPIIRKCMFYGSLIGMITSSALLICISPMVIERTMTISETFHSSNNFLLQCITCLCAVGIILSTIFNGFGSISLPYSCLAGLLLEPIPQDIISNAEIELEQAKTNLKNKIYELSSNDTTIPLGTGSSSSISSIVSNNSSNSTSPPKQSSFSLWSPRKVRRNFSELGDATQRRKMLLTSEIEFLESLIDDMIANVDEMKYTQSISLDARTTTGKIRSYMGIFFSIILLSRLASALTNVGKHYIIGISLFDQIASTSETNIDLVTRIILWLSGHNVAPRDTLHTLSQCISLSLTAMLSISQIRVFLRIMTTIQRRLHHITNKCYCQPFHRCNSNSNNIHRRHKLKLSTSFIDDTISSLMTLPQQASDNQTNMITGNNMWFLSHPISFLLCCYCLACIVLIKMMLPMEYRTNFSNALFITSTTDKFHHHPTTNTLFSIRTYTIDVIFTITAFITGTILAIILSFMRSNIRRIQQSDNNKNNNQEYTFHKSTSLNHTATEVP